MTKHVAFHISDFNFRGTNSATFEYARVCQDRLKHRVTILCPKGMQGDAQVQRRFRKSFDCVEYASLTHDLKDLNIDLIYLLTHGKTIHEHRANERGNDANLEIWTSANEYPNEIQAIPILYHWVYEIPCVNGKAEKRRQICVSASVQRTHSSIKVVPHIIAQPNMAIHDNTRSIVRAYLGIPKNAVVFGRLGGNDTFDAAFVLGAMRDLLRDFDNTFFLFATTPLIIMNDAELCAHPRVLLLHPVIDPLVKQGVIMACDAMLHASAFMGESFGISLLEFLACGKHVFTYSPPENTRHPVLFHDQHLRHCRAVGDEHATLYTTKDQLVDQMRRFVTRNKRVNPPVSFLERFSDAAILALLATCL